MGILDFLKKEKKPAKATELPPLPDISSLPPLPDTPGAATPQAPLPPGVAPGPEPEEMPAEKIPPLNMPQEETSLTRGGAEDMPLFPEMPEEGIPEDVPEEKPLVRTDEIEEIPQKVPELEELPEPPSFQPGLEEPKPLKEIQLIKMPQPGAPAPEHKELPTHVPPLEGFKPTKFIAPAEAHLVMHRTAGGPLFVRMDEYKSLLDDISQMKTGFKENENLYTRLNDYRTEQDKKFESFHEALEDVQRKLLYIDKTLFEV
ncbi:hypothetical protein ACFL96_16375 [Thermoproteota archaeon]